MTRRSPSRNSGFAEAGEQLGDAAAGGLFDLGIGVAEGQAEAEGEPAADGGLAGAHQADQHQAAAGEAGREVARAGRPFELREHRPVRGDGVACHRCGG